MALFSFSFFEAELKKGSVPLTQSCLLYFHFKHNHNLKLAKGFHEITKKRNQDIF